MTQSFSITTTVSALNLKGGERRAVSFTVANISAASVRGRVTIRPEGAMPAAWVTLVGEDERDFVPAENEQFTFEVAPPADAPAGDYLFRARIVNVDLDRIDEDYADSSMVSLSVTEAEKKKRFPWWILVVAVAVVVLIIGAVLVFVFTRQAELEMTVVDQPDPVIAGSVVTYTATIDNVGSKAAANVVMTDTLPAGATLIGTGEGCLPTELNQRVVCSADEVRTDEPVVFQWVVAVSGSTREELINDMRLVSDSTGGAEQARFFSETTAVTAMTTMLVELMSDKEAVDVGEPINYTAVVSNAGPSAATDVVLTLPIPEDVLVSASDNCTTVTTELRCELGSLGPGNDAVQTFAIVPGPGAIGTLQSRVNIVGAEAEAASELVAVTVRPTTGLSVIVAQPQLSEEAYLTGETVTFRVAVANNTDRDASAVTLVYRLPNNVNFDIMQSDQVLGKRDCVRELSDRVVTCDLRNMAVGASDLVEIHVIPTVAGTSQHVFNVDSPGFATAGNAEDPFALQAVTTLVCPSGCPHNRIQAAIDAAQPGTIIGIGDGRYEENITITKNVTLQGSRTGSTVVDGNHTGRVFTVDTGATVTMNRLTIVDGLAPSGQVGFPGGDGGGILNLGTLTLNNCVVVNNAAGNGAAGIDGLGLSGERGGRGGGIFNDGTLNLNNSSVRNNRAGNGGNGGAGFSFPFGGGRSGGNGGAGGSGGGIYNNGTYRNTGSAVTDNAVGSPGRGGNGDPSGRNGAPGEGPDVFNAVTPGIVCCLISPEIREVDPGFIPALLPTATPGE